MSKLRYRVGASAPSTHLFDVTIDVPQIARQTIQLELPVWIPGSYMVRDYARHVVNLSAREENGDSIAVTRVGKSRWSVASAGQAVQISMTVYGWDLSVRGAHLDQSHAYFNGACLLPRVDGMDDATHLLTVERPAGLPTEAIVATSMRPIDIDGAGFGEYVADDYDELIDHPFEIAVQQCVEFEAAGIPHRFFLRGAPTFDHTRLAEDCTRICAHHHTLLGTPQELDRYVFLAYALDQGYGGLEHRWSSSLAISRSALPQPFGQTDEKAYRTLLGLISHEYFHLWNVKRLKPAAFVPMDLSREVHTELLWVFEGITSYYDDLGLVRAGVISPDEYLVLLAQNLTRILRTPGRHQQPVGESSFDAWTKFYKQDENAPNAIISYYAKGALVALALDLMLRRDTSTTLDDVMRECWQRFYLNGGSGMPEDGLECVASELAGQSLQSFFDHAVRGTDDIDIAALFDSVGVRYEVQAATGADDAGGVAADSGHYHAYMGLRLDPRQPGRIATVINDSPAAHAGLSANDVLVAVDHQKIDRAGLDRLLRLSEPGAQVRVHAFRRDELITTNLTLSAPPLDTVALSLRDDVKATTESRRDAWLRYR